MLDPVSRNLGKDATDIESRRSSIAAVSFIPRNGDRHKFHTPNYHKATKIKMRNKKDFSIACVAARYHGSGSLRKGLPLPSAQDPKRQRVNCAKLVETS